MDKTALELLVSLFADKSIDEDKFLSKLGVNVPSIQLVLTDLSKGKVSQSEAVDLIIKAMEKSDFTKFIKSFVKKYDLLDQLSLVYTLLSQIEGVKELEADFQFDVKNEADFEGLRELVYCTFPQYRKNKDKAHSIFLSGVTGISTPPVLEKTTVEVEEDF